MWILRSCLQVRSVMLTMFFVVGISGTVVGQGNGWNVNLAGRWYSGPCYAAAANGSIAYFGGGTVFVVVDFSVPGTPVELARLVLPDLVAGITVSGVYAYVADSYAGLRVIDISTPSAQSMVFVLTPVFVVANIIELKLLEEPELERRCG